MRKLEKRVRNIILGIVSILTVILLYNIGNISDALDDRKEKKEIYDERYSVMLKADSNDLNSLSSGISSFRWYVREYSPDRKMIKKFQEIVEDYYNLEEVKNLDIQSLSDAQSIRSFYADFSYIYEVKRYLEQEKKYKYINEEQIKNIEQLVLAREEKEEREQQRKLDFERGFTEKEVHQFMRDAFNKLTDNGENYIPEVHDAYIAQLASEKFNITPRAADRIFVDIERK